jgi:hypothetical protein
VIAWVGSRMTHKRGNNQHDLYHHLQPYNPCNQHDLYHHTQPCNCHIFHSFGTLPLV